MGRRGLGLFLALGLIGAVSGALLGELVLGRGNGVFVAPLSAAVGLLLAWALWRTRPEAQEEDAMVTRADEAPPRAGHRDGVTVRVAKSGQGRSGQAGRSKRGGQG